MDIKQLKIFRTVVEKRSFSTAAELMGLTQPTISFQIASLEQELNTKLLDRGGRATTPTRTGEILYRYTIQLLELTSEMEQAISKLQGLLWGEITIGASTIPGEYILPRLLQKYKEGHPGIDVTLVIGDTRTVMTRVLDNEIELGVVGASEKNEKLTFLPFITDKLTLIAPAQNTWFATNIATLEELQKAPFIMREEGSGTRTTMQQKLQEANISPDHLSIAMTLGSTAAIKTAVESGAGIAIVSEKAIRNEEKLGLIKVMNIQGLDMKRDFFIVHRKNKVLSPAAEALLQFLGEQR